MAGGRAVKSNCRTTRRAFTLVELLVVIAIIATRSSTSVKPWSARREAKPDKREADIVKPLELARMPCMPKTITSIQEGMPVWEAFCGNVCLGTARGRHGRAVCLTTGRRHRLRQAPPLGEPGLTNFR